MMDSSHVVLKIMASDTEIWIFYLYVTMVVGISESEGHRGIRSSSTGRDFSLQ